VPYFEIQNFAAGMDLRKSPLTAPAGTLRVLTNAHVTAGGEIEKRAAFVKLAAKAPAGSFGLASANGILYVFKQGGGNTGGAPDQPGIIGLPAVSGWTLTDILDWDLYAGRFYVSVAATATAGGTGMYHYYELGVPPSAAMAQVTTGAYGSAVRTYKSKIHAVYGNTLKFSAVGSPDQWTNQTGPPQYVGAGNIILSQEDADMDNLKGLEVYYDYLAVFSDDACQLWLINADPSQNQYKQTLRQSGTIAPKSIRQYGSGDVLFLGADGIRSLKAREQSLSAAVSDIGSPVDPAIRELYATKSTAYMSEATAMLQPFSGRYWMVFPDRIFVLSNFPNPKISAWSLYTPGFTVTDVCEANGAIYFRTDNNDLYKYGGLGAPVYDGTHIEVVTPFLGLDKPATFKRFIAIDVICTGAWNIYAAFNPDNQDAEDFLGTVTGPTLLTGQFAMMGHSTHISLRFRHIPFPGDTSQATISSVMVHYEFAETT